MYIGNKRHSISLSTREIELSEDEMREIFLYANKNEIAIIKRYFEIWEKNRSQKKRKKYHKSEKIKELFTKYYTPQQTKKEVLERISYELNITYKAVEKAYYKKA